MSQREKDSYMMIDMEKGSSKKLLKSQVVLEKKKKKEQKKQRINSNEPTQLQIEAKNDADELD